MKFRFGDRAEVVADSFYKNIIGVVVDFDTVRKDDPKDPQRAYKLDVGYGKEVWFAEDVLEVRT